jgi:POT family proton-dependent oligopeptide transporter
MSEATVQKKHPPGLYLLFTVEMWERFSYYGMRAILMLFMVKFLMLSTRFSGTVYGLYTGLVYLTPLFGGYLADRYLGARRSIVIGALVMAAGEFALTFCGLSMSPPPPGGAVTSLPFVTWALFYVGLSLLIVGNGFFKPNISTTVGKLYEQNDPRRDSAFTIFYMGINLGAFFSPLICGTLGERYGWFYGFGAAGVGMLAGLVIYLLGQERYLGDAGKQPGMSRTTIEKPHDPLTHEEKQRIAVIFILAFFVIFFWVSFEQAGSSLTLFADRLTNRVIPMVNWSHLWAEVQALFGGAAAVSQPWIVNWEFPASWFQSVNPVLIVLLAPLFSSIWLRLGMHKMEPSTPTKFAIGLGLLTLSMVVMVGASMLIGGDESGHIKVSWLWLGGCYFMCTLGELCLSPVGLSMVTKLSPLRFSSLLMGTWFGSNFLANLVSGLFAGLYDTMSKTTFFWILVGASGGATLVLVFLVKPLQKWMHGIH